MNISAQNIDFKELNEQIETALDEIVITDCFGQRFIGSGMDNKVITIYGTPGNALGAYLNGSSITVHGNAQDAVGDTMNEGKIVIHGNAGDTLGYAMRGGTIFIKGDAGYRSGIHMKQYTPLGGPDKKPVIVIGGKAGSFLGEYLAGGLIIVLGIGAEDEIPVGNFTGTGMHGGSIYIRTDKDLTNLPAQVSETVANDLTEIEPYLREYAEYFGTDADALLKDRFYVLRPNAKNPYKQLYTAN